jgi:exopolysaccharide biosynthesis polyprenyl glycosylphosphotransferase
MSNKRIGREERGGFHMKFYNPINPLKINYEETTLTLAMPEAKINLSDSRQNVWLKYLAWPFRKAWRTRLTVGFLDILGAILGLLIGFLLSKRIFKVEAEFETYLTAWLCYCILLVLLYYLKGGYAKLNSRRPEQELKIIVTGNWWAIILIFTINFVIYKGIIFSRLILLNGFILSIFFIITFRFGLREFLKTLWKYRMVRENTIIVGDKFNDIQWFIKHLNIQRYKGINIVGYIAENPSLELNNNLKYLGKFESMPQIAKLIKVDKIIFAMRGYNDNRYNALLSRLEECERLRISSAVFSRIFNNFYFSLQMDGYSGIFGVARKEPAYTKFTFRIMKRTIDVLGSLAILFASLPIWIITIICIKLDDGGPIFFRHHLVGKLGNPLQMLKFRTMLIDAQEILKKDPQLLAEFNRNFKLKNDPRVTRVGKWLRKTSLDELPQLINILKGDMSLVGPRPVKAEELERYGEFKYERIKIKPGLTGFWQVSGRCSTTYVERIQMDKFYMYKGSIWLDLVILLKTPLIVFLGKGAE